MFIICFRNFLFPNLVAPVSFSIRTKDETSSALQAKPPLTLGHSSDDDDSEKLKQSNETKSSGVSSNFLPLVGSRNRQPISTVPIKKSTEVDLSESFIRDSILEAEANVGKSANHRGDEKIKNRLAQIAREKLGGASKQKQLQIERRKKAMAFMTQITGEKSIFGIQKKKSRCSRIK